MLPIYLRVCVLSIKWGSIIVTWIENTLNQIKSNLYYVVNQQDNTVLLEMICIVVGNLLATLISAYFAIGCNATRKWNYNTRWRIRLNDVWWVWRDNRKQSSHLIRDTRCKQVCIIIMQPWLTYQTHNTLSSIKCNNGFITLSNSLYKCEIPDPVAWSVMCQRFLLVQCLIYRMFKPKPRW